MVYPGCKTLEERTAAIKNGLKEKEPREHLKAISPHLKDRRIRLDISRNQSNRLERSVKSVI